MWFPVRKKTQPTDNLFKFKDYVSHTTSRRQSVLSPIQIELAKALTQFELDQEISNDILKIKPSLKGKLTIRNQRLLEFTPSEPMKADIEYEITLFLDKLYDDLEKGMEKFQFTFKTITPDFKVDLQALQSYSKQYNYIEGQIEASDDIAFAKAQQLIKATQNGKSLSIIWFEKERIGRYHPFRIDSISRAEEDTNINVQWQGDAIGANETEGENTLKIPGRNNFAIVGVDQTRGASASLSINFSDPIKEKQNFAGLVTIHEQGIFVLK